MFVILVSYAMYTFTGTGTTEYVVKTGNISVSFAQSDVFTLSNQTASENYSFKIKAYAIQSI